MQAGTSTCHGDTSMPACPQMHTIYGNTNHTAGAHYVALPSSVRPNPMAVGGWPAPKPQQQQQQTPPPLGIPPPRPPLAAGTQPDACSPSLDLRAAGGCFKTGHSHCHCTGQKQQHVQHVKQAAPAVQPRARRLPLRPHAASAAPDAVLQPTGGATWTVGHQDRGRGRAPCRAAAHTSPPAPAPAAREGPPAGGAGPWPACMQGCAQAARVHTAAAPTRART